MISRLNYSRKEQMIEWLFVVGFCIIAVLGLGAIAYSCTGYFATGSSTIVVYDKERVCDQNDCKYLIYTDGTTYEITDSLIDGRFNSSDVYGRIRPCHSYDVEWRGRRTPVISSYQNITAIIEDNGKVEGCEPT